ncbi:sodium- and chloride-dependent glycine transporter 1-like isoform X3 [Ruditapes philippinarum]|uniref:sodium- and chloride-dependent glycine transporter 1-like isoform X1 n=1 Tax=Ruditapes philippinarum TaxID=129788 RepID=UPI00295A63E9|nr:sodium- and chloride-dependent glycine transporter 1-like isoform X1 [Ruditapes philippinarum]XP_060568756.1 sodium- and chloride-dependent glycine transporter 1-like isoform X3 [Ruditapes philippinarum]
MTENNCNGILSRGTEKYGGDGDHKDDKKKYGVAWYKDETQNKGQYPMEDENPNESLVQDVSSTAVLTPLDDDLVGNVTDVPDRGNWGGRFDFLMSLLGYSVGLGNVWRFPYLAYSNGGGAFVFPFVLMLFLLGLPLMFLELSLGQFAGLGPAVVFGRFCPLFHGLGYGMIFISAIVSLYYTVIIAWCILYLFMSFRAELLWERCHEPWASSTCFSYLDADECQQTNGSIYYKTVCYNESAAIANNIAQLVKNVTKHAPAQDYFERGVLNMSDGIEHMGMPQWPILLCLAAAWTLTFLALSKGVKSSGKVVYFTALFPYVVLFILFFRGVTLPGAKQGIMYYITPRFEKLGNAKVWSDAAAQIFFALSPAWGGLITLSSYNKFHNNCLKDTLIVAFGNIGTSLFAGFVIFAIIGYLAQELNMNIEDVVDQGAGLAFIVYPDVVTRLPISPLWSILFFVMMITLGMGSEFALLETCMTAVQDTMPSLRQKKTWVVLCVCILGFFGGVAVTCEGGIYVLQLMDTYVSSWSVFVMAATESVLFGWVYGTDRFLQDVELMIGSMRRWRYFFALFWQYLSPLTLFGVFVFNLIQYTPITYDKYKYPSWADGLGWILALFPLMWIGGSMIWKITTVKEDISLLEKVKFLLKPSPEWGPAHKLPKFDLQDLEGEKNIENPNFISSNDSVTKI